MTPSNRRQPTHSPKLFASDSVVCFLQVDNTCVDDRRLWHTPKISKFEVSCILFIWKTIQRSPVLLPICQSLIRSFHFSVIFYTAPLLSVPHSQALTPPSLHVDMLFTLYAFVVVGLCYWLLPKVGGPEARLKREPLWWRHHTQSTLISIFDHWSSLRYVQWIICSWDYSMTDRAEGENAKGCSWYTSLKTLEVGKARLAIHKTYYAIQHINFSSCTRS